MSQFPKRNGANDRDRWKWKHEKTVDHKRQLHMTSVKMRMINAIGGGD